MKLVISCFCLLAFALISCYSHDTSSLLRVCYYTPFQDPPPSKLNSTLCTHIIAGFACVKDGLLYLNESFSASFFDVVKLKKSDPTLKVLLSVGGGGNNSPFSSAVNSTLNRTRLIFSIGSQLIPYGFDGLDIDWEFPVWNDNDKEDKENFIKFLQEFKALAYLFASTYNRDPLLLSVAVAGPKTIIDVAYDVPEMAKSVDFINLMSYDYHDYFWYTPFTGLNSPLFNRSIETGYFATLNTAWSANYFYERGMPKSKIIVGIPTYSHVYLLAYADNNGIDAPASNSDGEMSFPEVCNFIAEGGTRVFDNESQVPYAFKDLVWVSYEDEISIRGKAKWIVEQGYGGAMTYNLNNDDWQGLCDNISFPLHNIVYEIFTQ